MAAGAPESTWGIPSRTRGVLKSSILELRALLEEDARRQLAALGITESGLGETPGALLAEDARVRRVALTVIGRRREAGESLAEAVADYVTETAFTFLDRAVALRCLEERGLLLVDGQPETVIKLDPVRGSSSLVWRGRAESSGRPPREVARDAFRRACAAVSERIRVLFDPDDEHAALFPLLATWERVVAVLNAPDVPSETYAEDEVLGWVYQYWNSAAKDAVYAKLGKGGKIETPEELSAASCLYTERYIVDYLVQNTLGATWVEMYPESVLPATWPYYVRPPAGNLPVTRAPRPVREITLLDPACGSGHFLVRAFELFAQLYAEEGVEDPAEVPSLILEHNLHGIDIDRRAVQIAALALYLKGCTAAGPDFRPRKLNLVAADIVLPPDPPADFIAKFEDRDLADVAKGLWAGLQGIREFGSLLHPERTVNSAFRRLRARDRDGLWAKDDAAWTKRRTQLITELRRAVRRETGETDLGRHLFGTEACRGLDLLQVLGRRYDVVVANPPYAGTRNLGPSLRAFVDREYGDGRADLYGAFILRCDEFCRRGGRTGMVTRHSWMFLKDFQKLRGLLLAERHFEALLSLGPAAFEEITGEVVRAVAFVLTRRTPDQSSQVMGIRVPESLDAAEKRAYLLARISKGEGHTQVQQAFSKLPGSPLVFWLPPKIVNLYAEGKLLRHAADLGWAMASCDNDRFLRQVWEVPPGRDVGRPWRQLVKAGGYRRWSGLQRWLLDWLDDGTPIKELISQRYPYLKGKTNWLVKESNFGMTGWTYSLMAGGSLGARTLSPDELTDSASPGVFPSEHDAAIGGLLNCRLSSYILRAITPDSKFREGYVGDLPIPRDLGEIRSDIIQACIALARLRTSCDPLERSFGDLADQGRSETVSALLNTLEGWNERLVFDAFELDPNDVRAVLDETGTPAGWYPLIAAYDRLPEAPAEIDIPAGLADFLGTLDHCALNAPQLTQLKSRLRRLYEAGRGGKVVDDGGAEDNGDEEDEVGGAVGAQIPIPTETFLEELSQRLEIHPISVHWLLEELRAEGVVSPSERKHEIEDYLVVTLLWMLGYRWPEQDAYEAENGPLLDPDLVDADGIIPLVPCADEPTAETRITTRLERAFGDEGAEAFLRDVRRYLGRDLGEWLRRDCFKRHAQQFKNRPIAWHFRSPADHFEAFVLYHRLSRATLATLRTTYAGGRIARLRAEQARVKERGDTTRVSDLQVAIEDVELFRTRLEAIERGDTLADRIRCRWKDETAAGRPGPYAPDIDDGVKVNIRPFQEQGLLAAKVIAKW